MARTNIIILSAILVTVAGALALWRITRPATLPHASCGDAITHVLDGSTQVLGDDQGSLDCFRSAAQRCSAASIEVTAVGVDFGTHYVFTIEPGGTPCQVTELSQDYGGPGPTRDPVVSRLCSITAVTAEGVTLTCDGQAVLIPEVASAP
ncbi:MAG: hypothetical protein LBV34_19565 [Nocardiopsaceae bacterium]|nr:hypothetical protein [Nocardiopsaceae bacterium]